MFDSASPPAGNSKKYLWIIMILPIGLIIGTITSAYNHIKSDLEKNDGSAHWVSVDFDPKSIKADIELAFNHPTTENEMQIRRISSALGLDAYLSTRMLKDNQGKVGYLDIESEESDEIVVVVVELDQQDAVAKSTQIGLSVAVIKSLLGEKKFTKTLRFIYVPETKSASELVKQVIERGEKLTDLYILRPSTLQTDLEDRVRWLSVQVAGFGKVHVLSHPAFNVGKQELTPKLLDLTHSASKNFREFLIQKVK